MHPDCVQQGLKHNAGAEWSHFNLITSWLRKKRCALYGHNDITFARPNLFLLIAETLSYPIFVIQVYAHPQNVLPTMRHNMHVFSGPQRSALSSNVFVSYHHSQTCLADELSCANSKMCMRLPTACAHCLQQSLSLLQHTCRNVGHIRRHVSLTVPFTLCSTWSWHLKYMRGGIHMLLCCSSSL